MDKLIRSHKLKPAVLSFTNKNGRNYAKAAKFEKECPSEPTPLMNLACKVALIYGGTGGIGLPIAHQILSRKAKAVALVGTDICAGREAVKTLNCSYGKNKALFLAGDVQCSVQLSETFNKVKEELGKIDVLVNAAGIMMGCQWEQELFTNFMATVRSTVNAYQYMSKLNGGIGGTILNLSGTHGVEPLPAAPTLSAAYHGIIGLSRSLGDMSNYQKTGVRIVTLCPGITQTNFIKDADKTALDAHMARDLQTFLAGAKRQKADVVGCSAFHVLMYGPTSSVWTIEASKLYLLNIPHWREYAILKSQLI